MTRLGESGGTPICELQGGYHRLAASLLGSPLAFHPLGGGGIRAWRGSPSALHPLMDGGISTTLHPRMGGPGCFAFVSCRGVPHSFASCMVCVCVCVALQPCIKRGLSELLCIHGW